MVSGPINQWPEKRTIAELAHLFNRWTVTSVAVRAARSRRWGIEQHLDGGGDGDDAVSAGLISFPTLSVGAASEGSGGCSESAMAGLLEDCVDLRRIESMERRLLDLLLLMFFFFFSRGTNSILKCI